jgi:hypothetical protein
MTETEFQAQVVQLAGICGWRHLHVRRSIGKGRSWVTATNIVGWPDLVLMRPPGDLIFAELKVKPNRPTVEQLEVLEFLRGYPFARACLWYPEDWDDIEATLKRRPGP